jgi:pyruvate/2-oxoglutarate/acetoin dehydrogenase E1 component
MRKITIREALNEALHEEMARDSRVVVLGCDVGNRGGPFGITKGILDRFGPSRIWDTPISEPAFTGAGVGAAATGLRPIVEILYSDWITLGMDQIVNMAAKMRYMFGGKVNMPLVIRAPFGAGNCYAAQHSQSFENWFNHVPGLKVVAPWSAYDMKGLLKAAIRDDNPVIFFEHKRMYAIKGEVPDLEEDYIVPIGKAKVLREGSDLTAVTYSYITTRVLAAAAQLEKETGAGVEVVDLRTILPLDYDTVLASVRKTGRLLVVHEANTRGGLGSDIVAEVTDRAYDALKAPPLRVGGLNVPMPYNRGLESMVIPDEARILEAMKRSLSYQ